MSCAGDKVNLTTEALQGQWLIFEAYRDGRETRTLKDGYFEFTDSEKFKTNIMNDTMLYDYELSGNKVKVNSTPNLDYTVLYMQSDTLIMRTEIQKLDFIFVSAKSQHHDHVQ